MLEKLQAPFKGRKGRPELVAVLKALAEQDNSSAVTQAEQVAAGLTAEDTSAVETGSHQPAADSAAPVPVPAPAPPQPSSKKRKSASNADAKPTPQPDPVQPAAEKTPAPKPLAARRRG